MASDPDYIDFRPDERPDVEVLVDGTWRPGELRAWSRREDGWWGHVRYRMGVSEQFSETLPVERIRKADDELLLPPDI